MSHMTKTAVKDAILRSLNIQPILALSRRDLLVNLVLYLIGITFLPLGVVLTINSHAGAGGPDALSFAVADLLCAQPSVGVALTGIVVVIAAALIRRQLPRLTVFVTSLLVGLITDFWKWVLTGVEGTELLSKALLFIPGVMVVAVSVASYILSVFPAGPNDDLIQAMKERGFRIIIAKVGVDVIMVLLAFLLGGEIGVGTLLLLVALGPLVDLIYGILRKPMDRHHITVA